MAQAVPMSNPAAPPRNWLTGLARFLPAMLLFGSASVLTHPTVLILLLAAAALTMTAMAAALGCVDEVRWGRDIARRGVTFFVLLSLYVSVVAALLAAPAWWLLREPSLAAALTLSAAGLLALCSLWRLWPSFALPFVWDDAYPPPDQGSWLLTSLRRSLAFARHLSGEHELFFSHGLPAALAILLISVGALILAGSGSLLDAEMRSVVVAVFALLVVPAGCWIVLGRCMNALLSERRSRRATLPGATESDPNLPILPAGIGPLELNTTLLAATRAAQVDLALAALQRGADPDLTPASNERDQRSVLLLAVTLQDLRLLRALIGKGVVVNRVHRGMAALHAATRDSYQGRPDAIMTLLANGADPAVADSDGNTALHHAALCGEPIVAALLLDAGADIDALNHDGLTPLGIACTHANWALAAFLLERGAASAVAPGQPSLLQAAAAQDDDSDGVQLLLKRKADVNATGLLGRSALMVAALAGNAHIAELLLSAGIDIELTDQQGTTALMEAARAGAVAIIHALGKRKVDPDRVDATGRSALAIACASRQASEETVRALLALRADRDLVGSDGKRALDHAASSGRWHIVALLDPAYPVPSSLAIAPATIEAASAAHLLDALRFSHWNVVADFRALVRDWPEAELADIYLALAEAPYSAARNWLSNNGLSADARLADGSTLLDRLLQQLPGSLVAVNDLLARGAAVGGAGLLARVLQSGVDANPPEPIARLAMQLLERGADWCGSLSGGVSALHLAAANGDAELVHALLERGAAVDAHDVRARTPLQLALKIPDPARADAVVRLLVVHGANPESAAASGETALGLALSRGDRGLVNWLSWPRWRLPARPLRGSDLPAAAAIGDRDAVEKLLTLGLPVDSVDEQGASALIRAAGCGFAPLVSRLLAARANPSLQAKSGSTALTAAVAGRREEVVRCLLQHGVEVDQRLPGGGTALMVAAGLGLPVLADALLTAGADVNAQDERGNTALLIAAEFAFATPATALAGDLFELLLRHGARLEQRNPAGQDVLMLLLGAHAKPGSSCDGQHLAHLATLLAQRGAALDHQDQRGVSALHACALHGLLIPARALKSRGAPLDQQDSLGRSASDVAALLGYSDVAHELDADNNPVPSPRQTLRKRVLD